MLMNRIRSLATPFALAALVVTLPACSDDDDPAGPGEDPYVGTWTATTFSALGTNFIAQGMTLEATFTTSTYAFVVTGDLVDLCGDEGPDCADGGTLEATESEMTLDAGTEDEVTFSYTATSSTMNWSGAIDGTPLTVTWTRND